MCQILLYQPSDTVCWNTNRSNDPHLRWMMEQYGEGPFTVISVCDVPTRCTCYLQDDEEAPPEQHHEQCNVRLRESVGHPQWVSVETPVGVVKQFSGAWFQLAN